MKIMNQKLRAKALDIPLLSDYLHDANISINDISYDEVSKKFKLSLQRIAYESGQEGKMLWLIPVTRYPIIESILSVLDVKKMEMKWLDGAFKDDAGYPHQLLEITLDNSILSLSSDMFIIYLSVSDSPEIFLEDISNPSDEKQITDLATGVFFGIEEIERLKM